jgi:hypothetical protein
MRHLLIAVLFIASSLAGSLILMVRQSDAAGFSMQTGYYVGTGVTGKAVSGLGFQPDLVIIKAKTGASATAAATVFRTSAMATANSAYFAATADSTATPITFTSDGFTLGTLAAVNSASVIYAWTAFSGSDCSSSGSFCVGTYTGDGALSKTFTTGFQPDVLMVKRSNGIAGHFHTSTMAANQTDFFNTTANDTTGDYIKTINSNGFTVGITDNTNNGVYYYIAFKNTSGKVATGSFTGDGTDNRTITGVGFKPDMVMMKNDTSATAANTNSVMSSKEYNGDAANFIGDVPATFIDMQDQIQKMDTNGFQVGTSANTNESGATIQWIAFGGVPAASGATGTFKMATGTFTGNSTSRPFTGLGFAPDLVIVKDTSTSYAVFRTSIMASASAAYFANAATDVSNTITSMDSDGFTLGTSNVTNGNTRTYHWQAFGNAYRPDTKKGAADFAIGAYSPTLADDTTIGGLPFQLDFVAVKQQGASSAVFHTSAQPNDVSGYLSSTAEASGMIKSFSPDGFQIGTSAKTNDTASYRWFGFKAGTNFAVGTYTGNGVVDRAVTIGSGFQPDLIWIKQSSTAASAGRSASMTGDTTHFFVASANAAGAIKSVTSTGITVGTTSSVNASGSTYRYMAWRVPVGVLSGDIVDSGGGSVVSPSFSMNGANYLFGCEEVMGALGTASQRLRVSNMTSNAAWTTSIAATDGPTAVWKTGDNAQQYDYNESSGSPAGCTDGSDTDTVAGKLRIEPSAATLTPQAGGCTTTGISLGSNTDFNESSVNAITLMSASGSANIGCYWDLTGVMLRQYIPQAQAGGTYTLNLTITTSSS